MLGAGIALLKGGMPGRVSPGVPKQPRVQRAEPTPYSALIGASVKARARKVFVTEMHNDPHSVRWVAQTLEAVKDAVPGETVPLYREMGAGALEAQRSREHTCAHGQDSHRRDVQEKCQNEVVNSFDHSHEGFEPPSMDDKRSLKKALSADVALGFMMFDDPTQFDLERFIHDKSVVAVGSMGLVHASGYIDGKGDVQDPCLNANFGNPYPEVNSEANEAMWDGYAKALKEGGAVLVIPASAFDRFAAALDGSDGPGSAIRARCQTHFQSRNLLVTEVASDGFNGTVIAPRQMRGHFNKVARQYPGTISFVGEGGSGWGTKSSKPRDEKGSVPGGS